MRIYAKVNKHISDMSYVAITDNGVVRMDVYKWPVYNQKHVVICATGQNQVSFMALEFSMQNAIEILKAYAKAYI